MTIVPLSGPVRSMAPLGGRLGHGGGGATTLRVYASFVAAADRRAAEVLGQRHRPPSTDA
jgi:integrase